MQEFHFVEQNGWPVSAKQENSLSLLDVCNGSHVTINTERVLLTPSRISSQGDNLPFKASTANRYGICQTRSSIKYSMSINLLKYTYLYVLRYVFHGTRLLVSVLKIFLIVFFLSVHITILMKLAWLYQVKKKKNYDNCIAYMIHTQE